MWSLSWHWQGSFRDTWRARSHFCILKDIEWHFIFGRHSVYSRTLTEDTKYKWTKSLRELTPASAEHQAWLFLLCLDQVLFVVVVLFVCWSVWIQSRKETFQSVLTFARACSLPLLPTWWQHSFDLLFPQRAGKPPVAQNSTCAGSKMTIVMLVMSQSLGAFQDLNTSWMLKKPYTWHLVHLMGPRWDQKSPEALDCVVVSLKKGLRSFGVKTSGELQPCTRGKHNFMRFMVSFSLRKNVLEFQAGLHVYCDFYYIATTSGVDGEKSPKGRNVWQDEKVLFIVWGQRSEWADGLDTIAVVEPEMLRCCCHRVRSWL